MIGTDSTLVVIHRPTAKHRQTIIPCVQKQITTNASSTAFPRPGRIPMPTGVWSKTHLPTSRDQGGRLGLAAPIGGVGMPSRRAVSSRSMNRSPEVVPSYRIGPEWSTPQTGPLLVYSSRTCGSRQRHFENRGHALRSTGPFPTISHVLVFESREWGLTNECKTVENGSVDRKAYPRF